MYLKEDEAKGKWCPQGRLQSNTFRSSYNIYPTNDIATRCIASKCMMWQWKRKFIQNEAGQIIRDATPGVDPFTHGYCGLAGRPE